MTAASAPRGFPAPAPTPRVSAMTWVSVFGRLLAIQGSWNYETLLGNGIGFALEPVLRRLPGGVHGDAFKAAMTRESAYFNAHPYLTSVAVGALARAELSGVPPERIERFRTALCGPLGSVGDRLIWAGWLPFSSLVALVAFGFGAAPVPVILIFLGLYNAGHFGLRVWGLYVGWTRGLAVATALAKSGASAGTGIHCACCRGRGRRRHPSRRVAHSRLRRLALRRCARQRRPHRRGARSPAWPCGRLEARARADRPLRPRLGGPLMVERTVQILNKNGLHARPAAEIVKVAAKFASEITIARDDLEVNGKSIMGVMMLAAECGASVRLRADGADAEGAVDAIATLIANKFGER